MEPGPLEGPLQLELKQKLVASQKQSEQGHLDFVGLLEKPLKTWPSLLHGQNQIEK